MSDTSSENLLIDASTAAARLSISERLLWGMTKRGEIPVVRLGRRVLYDPADLRVWIQKQKTRGDESPVQVG